MDAILDFIHFDASLWGISRGVFLLVSMLLSGIATVFAVQGFIELTAKKSQELGFGQGNIEAEAPEDSFFLRWFRPIFPSVIVWIKPFLQEEQLEGLRTTIRRAGLVKTISPEEFMALKVILTILGPFLLGPAIGQFTGHSNLSYYFAGLVFGWFSADLWLYEQGKQRSAKLLRALPDMLDMLVLLVEAGLDLSAAMMKLADALPPTPLRDEVRTMISDMRLGASRIDAFKALADRCALMEVNSFVSVLVQAISMGASIGPVLRTQSDMLRLARFQKAERLGAEAANKVLIPMFLFIFPAIFAVAIGPVVVDFIRHPPGIF